MSPMNSLQFFQPMVHTPLKKIDDIFRVPKPITEYLIYNKPIGIDVYMVGGKIFDFNHKELINRTLLFTFEKILNTTVQIQGLFIGTLVSVTEPTKIIKHRSLLYMDENTLPLTVRFLAYDIVFPYFKVEDNPFWVRNDITKKTIGNTPGCTCLDLQQVNTLKEFKGYVKQRFNVDRHTSFIIFDRSGKYHSGTRQLTYSPEDKVSFELSASQKYRSHIKKILPVEVEISEGNLVTVAGSITARFKNRNIIVPIIMPNYILRKNLWEHRKELKKTPFVFEGIYCEDEDNFEILGMHYSKFVL